MKMELQPADYVLCALALTAAVTGLFRGFSGTLAFLAAIAAGGTAASFVWTFSAGFTPEVWMRAAATLVAALLAFGIVRLVVKKLVNGLLAQPSDAIFGMIVGAVCGALATVAWASSGMFLEYSSLASMVADLMR
jgi:uncharacterized membrane protein required for colicin V production